MVETIYRAETEEQDYHHEDDVLKNINGIWYAIGQYSAYNGYATIFNEFGGEGIKVNKSTLAIYFTNSNMNDSEGMPIFASLSEDGNGGDEIKHKGEFLESKEDLIAILKHASAVMFSPITGASFKLIEWAGFSVKVTGIYTTGEE